MISIEPGIYLQRVGDIRHSDTVLVTKDGHELLTRFPIELSSLVIHSWKSFDSPQRKIGAVGAGLPHKMEA